MGSLLYRLGVALACLTFVPVGVLTASVINTETSEWRAGRLDAHLRDTVPPGSDIERVRGWLTANGFCCATELESRTQGYLFGFPDDFEISVTTSDPAWFSSARMVIKLRLDDQGRIVSTRVSARTT